MASAEAYKEHIEYTFNAFCRVVIRYAAINVWRNRNRPRQRKISFEYLTEEMFCPLSTSDKYFIEPYKQYPVTICSQTVIGEMSVMHISMMLFQRALCPRQSVLRKTRSQLRYGAVLGDWGPSTNKQFCEAKSQSVYHSALLASFVWVLSLREVSTLKVRSC